MANYAVSRMKVSGPEVEIARFVYECFDSSDPENIWIDLEKSVPPPGHLVQRGRLSSSQEGKNWALANWGTNILTNQQVVHRQDGLLEMTYSSPWAPPYVFNQILAQRFPELVINIVCYETGNDFGYRFKAYHGVVDAMELGADETLIREVEGPDADDIPRQTEIDEMRTGASARLAALTRISPTKQPPKRGFLSRVFNR